MTRFSWFDFSGSLNRSASDFNRKDSETQRSVNVLYSTVGNIKKRKGYYQRGGLITTTSTSSSTSTTTTSTSTTSTSTSTTSTSTTTT